MQALAWAREDLDLAERRLLAPITPIEASAFWRPWLPEPRNPPWATTPASETTRPDRSATNSRRVHPAHHP
jgi:hypothetical protein